MAEYYEFEVSLRGAKPRLWRRFQLRKTATFQDLHDAIQDACGWEDCHLFSFATSFGRNAEEIATGIPPGAAFDEPEAPPASKVKLKSYFEYEAKCGYVYDFGDGWQHDIKCTPIVAESRFKRRLIDGKGTFPPEDCGGLWGFERCVNVFKGKEEDEEGLKEWLGDWTPNNFSLAEVREKFDQ
ncbi:MAG TPA: plasmid pRiA4b ORF-3 family protein [Oligoflexus sp.]|uniref:plasmid pRiA4b ORF-3 family protein n=1 Tax=Oligoflexus sp. TaxID=1971216 RepID=UPI002D4F3AFC|nr:plasmid pRiA4b ORF-3 family protein [Oligoflexus sp.]HYX34237.1 plasmid pRiA4b ORF-3 family protein [Oligoflexus sp.]